MLASILTTLAILLLFCGVGIYSHRRVSKVWRAQQERSAAAEAALLSAATVLTDEPADSADHVNESPLIDLGEQPEDDEDAEPEQAEVRPAVPRTVEEDIRAFFGASSAEVPVPADLPVPAVGVSGRHAAEPEPVAADRLDAAVAALAQAFRDAATAVEQAAVHGDPDPAVRASRVWTVATSAIGVLPLSGLVTSHRASQQS